MALADLLSKVVGKPSTYHRKGNYEFGEILGAGAFGVVRKAHNVTTGEDVAAKVILRRKIKGRESDIMAELDLLRKLNHPHIVHLKDWFESREKIYIVTELCTGGELFDRICNEGNFTEQDAARTFREIADAIKYLHDRNIVHRDVKPENLLYSTKEPDSSLVLADFGIAKSLHSSEEMITSSAGSLGYAAPEIFTNEGHGKPCDIWSLGVVLYTMLCGYSPFQADTVNDFVREVGPNFQVTFHKKYWDGVSSDARRLVRRMIDFDPIMRPTIEEVLEDPWVSGGANNHDLLPTIKPGLGARARWRVAFEKVRLAKRIKALGLDDDDEEQQHPAPALKFHEIVLAAQRRKALDEKHTGEAETQAAAKAAPKTSPKPSGDDAKNNSSQPPITPPSDH